ncbi:MAG: DNA methylase, partial [Bacteroidales bacterium]|nr:DNA methylase [Bacteroidales bacterium]
VETASNKKDREITIRHYVEPDANDLAREEKVFALLTERFDQWQQEGCIPSMNILKGVETDRLLRERGWTHWHHLFNPRQLIWYGLLLESCNFLNVTNPTLRISVLLTLTRFLNFNSKLCIWDNSKYKSGGLGAFVQTFSNQALNTLFNYGSRAGESVNNSWYLGLSDNSIQSLVSIKPHDARTVSVISDYWITDPPYADAVNYHELGDFFLAWYEKHLPKLFPDWYTDSKSALAVKGNDQDFRESMVECYSNFTRNMPDNGAQVVMFTHQDSSVWADLALILWASGLQVTAAWTIQTETDSSLKTGNYVQGTVIMILRKQQSDKTAFLSDIQVDVEFEVRDQLRSMTELDDKEDPNFSDTDYQLAAYAAALRVLTSYRQIEDIDIHYELMKGRTPGEKNEIEKIIDSAVSVACDYLIPTGFDQNHWRQLSNEERFYIKGLEIQSHGEYRNGVYQELARGFGIRQYGQLLKTGKANETRLMTASEFGTRSLHDEDFGNTLLRNILFAINETRKEESPLAGRNWLHNELPDYWGLRDRVLVILYYLSRTCSALDNWPDDVKATNLLAGYIVNDHI